MADGINVNVVQTAAPPSPTPQTIIVQENKSNCCGNCLLCVLIAVIIIAGGRVPKTTYNAISCTENSVNRKHYFFRSFLLDRYRKNVSY